MLSQDAIQEPYTLQAWYIYQTWLQGLDGPSGILYAYGGDDLQEVSEQVFYELEDHSDGVRSKGRLVLYFSFDKYNDFNDMLSTFIAQMICHHPDHMAQWSDRMFAQLAVECGWTDQDALQWLDYLFDRSEYSQFYLVLHHFDECRGISRAAFFAWISRCLGSRELSWKVFITSFEPETLSKELPPESQSVNLQHTPLDKTAKSAQGRRWGLLKNQSKVSRSNLKVLDQELYEIALNGRLIREIVIDQLLYRKDWEGDIKSLKNLFEVESVGGSDDEILETILDNILRQVPGSFPTTMLLKWLLYSTRPLTVSEMCTFICHPMTSTAPDILAKEDCIQAFKRICEEWLSGIIDIRDNLVMLRHAQLRTVLTRPGVPGKRSFLWNQIQELEAEADITRTCLQFLSHPMVQETLKFMSNPMTPRSYPADLLGICSYVVRMWPHHYLSSFPEEPASTHPSLLLEEYRDSAITHAWLNAFWVLDNPITRPKVAWESAYPLFVALGLPPLSDEYDSGGMAAALPGAARYGRSEMTRNFLSHLQNSKSAVVDALVSAASGGQKRLLFSIWRRFHGIIVPGDLPPTLIYRVSWLGFHRILEKFLEAGCSTDPGGPMADEPCISSPLHQAVRFAHVETVKVLLKHGANGKFRTVLGRNILHTSVHSGSYDICKLLVGSDKANMSSVDSTGCTPIDFAVKWGFKQATKFLVQLGAGPEYSRRLKVSEGPGWGPLLLAASNGRSECVRILLEAGANPNQCGPNGKVSPMGSLTLINNSLNQRNRTNVIQEHCLAVRYLEQFSKHLQSSLGKGR